MVTARFSFVWERGVGMQSPSPKARPSQGTKMRTEIVKAQARTLRAGLAERGLALKQGHALELLAQMAGWPHWDAYSAALRREKAGPPTCEDQPGNLQRLLRGYGINLELTAAVELAATLTWQERPARVRGAPGGAAVGAPLGGRVTLFTVQDVGPLWSAQEQLYLETNETSILNDIEDVRPGLTSLLGEDREARLLAELLFTLEGPGLLAELGHAEGQTRWVYVQDEQEVALLARLHAAATASAQAGEDRVHAAIRRGQTLARRTMLPGEHFSGDIAGLFRRTTRWAHLWATGTGLRARLEQLQARHTPPFPWGEGPAADADETTRELDLLDRAEALAIQARLKQHAAPR